MAATLQLSPQSIYRNHEGPSCLRSHAFKINPYRFAPPKVPKSKPVQLARAFQEVFRIRATPQAFEPEGLTLALLLEESLRPP